MYQKLEDLKGNIEMLFSALNQVLTRRKFACAWCGTISALDDHGGFDSNLWLPVCKICYRNGEPVDDFGYMVRRKTK